MQVYTHTIVLFYSQFFLFNFKHILKYFLSPQVFSFVFFNESGAAARGDIRDAGKQS